ncbi:hypothetical protein ACVF5D_002283 [Vibrio vulnificus]
MFVKINFGDRVAENEAEDLNSYFVETSSWKELYDGRKDVVFGSKGAGKSALYTLLLKKEGELLKDRSTFLVSAEKPQGQTVFSDIKRYASNVRKRVCIPMENLFLPACY